MSSEHRRAYMREYMRIRNAKKKTGRDEPVGPGVVQSLGKVKKRKTGKKVVLKELPLEGAYVEGRHRSRRSGGKGSRTVEVEFPDGVRTIRDARFRVPNRRNVTPRPIDPLSGIKPKNTRCRSRSERLHLSYSPPVFYTKGGGSDPVSLCGGIWAPGRVVDDAPTSQLCRRCLAGRDAALRRATRESKSKDRFDKKFKRYQEMYGATKTGEVAFIDGKRAEAALAGYVPDPRGGSNRGKVRIRLIPAPECGQHQWVPLTTEIPFGAPSWCMKEVSTKTVKSPITGDITSEYSFPVPPPMVEHDGHRYWRKSLLEDGKRPVRYYREETSIEAAFKAEVSRTRARLLELWAEARSRSVEAESLTSFLDSVGIGGQKIGHLGLGSADDPIHYVEYRHSGRDSTYDYVAQYGANRFAVLLVGAVWVGSS